MSKPTVAFSQPARFGLILAIIICLIDQIHKFTMVYGLRIADQPIDILPFFRLVMVWNQGVSFGMLSDGEDHRRWLLIGTSLVITVWLGIWLMRVTSRRLALALGLIIGGAIGNVIDRLHWGAVADFFYFHYGDLYWPAFNIADSAIVIGVVLLCWDSIVSPAPNEQQK